MHDDDSEKKILEARLVIIRGTSGIEQATSIRYLRKRQMKQCWVTVQIIQTITTRYFNYGM